RGAWEGALYRLATPQKPGPEGLREALGERAFGGLEGLLRLGPDDLQALVSGTLDVVDSLRQGNAVPPGPEQHPRWLRRDWGRWRRAPALRAALDHLARSPSSVAVAMATAAGRMHASLPTTNGAPSGATVSLRRTTTGPSPAAGGDEAGRGERAQDGPEDRYPAEDWAPPPAAALPDAGPAAPGGEGGQREGSERDGGPAGGQAGGGSGPGALGALKVVAPGPEDRAAYWQLRGALAPEIERLTERLQAAGDRYYEATPRRFQRAGRLDRNRLPAAMAGREAVFARFVHRPAPANALCLLLDCSASMAPYAEQLREASILIESAATAVGARVSAFTFGAAWERLEPPAEGAPLVALGRELRPQGGTPFGPAVAAAAAWLGRQPYARRRLWVLSDGQWSARDRAAAAGRPDLLRDVLVWVLGAGSEGGSGGTAPAFVSPSPYLDVAPVGSLADLVRLAPARYWPTPWAA
ncbi:MAG TPA: hypothetical protein VHQ00_07930, partial [Chloroflexota bacterium]|nr:hypothetical protein [Chloroflexota bacterium]